MPMDSMFILSLETGLGPATVALLRDGVVISQASASEAHANAAETLPLCERLLAEADVSWDGLAAFACGLGPGSFTGIRIGLALARGLAFAAKKPLLGIGTLEATAFAAAEAGWKEGALCVALDAMREELYTQTFRLNEAGLPEPTEPPALRDAEGCRLWQQEQAAPFAGNAQSILGEWLGHAPNILPGMTEAGSLGRLAWRYHQAGATTSQDPVYVRLPDAKLPQKQRIIPE